MNSLKEQLYSHCLAFVQERIATAQEAIVSAQRSANEETKSSSGDKYETGRAMAQLEIEKFTAQLSVALEVKQTLEQILPDKKYDAVQRGSAVKTNQGSFYLAISAGQFIIDGETYFAISPASPIGQKLMGLRPQDTFIFNQKPYIIKEVI